MKIIFLDIDGVLNGHEYNPIAKSSTMRQYCVENLNKILDAVPEALIVVISAWRYMVLENAMTLRGFEYMLRTHGIHCAGRIVATLGKDVAPIDSCRGTMIKKALASSKDTIEISNYVILDDLQLGYDGLNFIQTNSKLGLSPVDTDKAIEYLTL